MDPLHAVYPTWLKCETCSLWCETTRYLATTLCMACEQHKQDSSQGYIHQQFQMIFWIRNDTVISIYALIFLLLGGIDGNQLRKGVHRPFWDHKIYWLLNIHYWEDFDAHWTISIHPWLFGWVAPLENLCSTSPVAYSLKWPGVNHI